MFCGGFLPYSWGLFSLRLLPSWHGLSDVYEPNRPMGYSQLLWEMRPTTGVGYFHGLKNELQDGMRREGMGLSSMPRTPYPLSPLLP
jgi:hypothetical protein